MLIPFIVAWGKPKNFHYKACFIVESFQPGMSEIKLCQIRRTILAALNPSLRKMEMIIHHVFGFPNVLGQILIHSLADDPKKS